MAEHTRRTGRVTTTGTAPTPLVDDAARNNRESKWTVRDNYVDQGTDGRTASGSVHTGRD